jgi:hypothetical protein
MKNFHPDHLDDLRKSGLNDETIERAEISTVMPPRQINKKLGFTMAGLSSMYEIPYPSCNGFSRFRCFYEDGKNGPKYLQRKDTGNHLYIPTLAASILDDPTKPLYFTEGEKKALKACQEGIPCIGLSGLWNWKIKDGGLIPDFDKIELKHRTAYIVPDNDWRLPNKHGYEKNLEQAVQELAYSLIDRGANVFIVELPDGPAKGIDDYLLTHSVDEFLALPSKRVRKLTLEEAVAEATLDTLNDVLKRISKIPSQAKQEALVGELAKRLNVSRTALKKDLKQFGAKIEGDQGDKKGLPMIALFPGLVDLVEDDGKAIFLIKDASGLRVENVVDIDGIQYVPPDKTDLPFLLPRAEQCFSHYKGDGLGLFDDILAYLRRFSRLPDDQWLVVGLFILSTYLQDHPAIRYSPMILFHAAPERGKSRSGKAVTYVAYRGVHLVDMRETNIFRYSGNLGATIFFDIMDLSKAIKRAGSTDIMLLRYEKGATVPRVLNPDRGAFKDTTHYPVFGPTIMASNAPVHKILGSRCITYTMPNAPGVYENPTKEFGQEIKERLVAWRCKMMDAPLQDILPIDGISGRLWDITKPLFQICLQSCSERYKDLVNAVCDIAGQRVQEKKESFDGLLIQVILEMTQGDATHFDISTADVTAKFNTLWNGDDKSEKWTGRRLNFLGIKTNTKTGRSRFTLDRQSRDTLVTQYGFLEGESNSRNSRNSKEADITIIKASEFPYSGNIETQRNSKADIHVNSTVFEKPEFPEFISEGVSRNEEKKNLKEVRI